MPKYARPVTPQPVEAAIEAFGNRVRVAIIGYLGDHAAADVSAIAAGIDVSPVTVYNHLRKLEELRLVYGNPADPTKRNGVRVMYSRDSTALRDLHTHLVRTARL